MTKNMYIWKTKSFDKWQQKVKLPEIKLVKAIKEINQGLIDVSLGAGLIKKRIAREGEGKSAGYRTIIATNKNDKWFFIEGFAKNEADNISTDELMALKELSDVLLTLSKAELEMTIKAKEIMEVNNEKK